MVIPLDQPNSKSLWDPYPEESPARFPICLPASADCDHVTLGPAMGSPHVTDVQDVSQRLWALLVLPQITAFTGALSKLCAMESMDRRGCKIQVQFLTLLLTAWSKCPTHMEVPTRSEHPCMLHDNTLNNALPEATLVLCYPLETVLLF